LSIKIDKLNPIFLIEEWLVLLGFTEEKDLEYSSNFILTNGRKTIMASYHEEMGDLIIFYRNDVGLEFIEIGINPPVHWLQNIYFLLFDEELTLKPTIEP
jgi:hypothetical protein